MASNTRFKIGAATTLRREIRAAGGVEVFAIGRLDEAGEVADLEVHCRGNSESVPALLGRPRPGEVVIHNHPSGTLRASRADMLLANRYGEDGIGVVIVDNEVTRALWVVEPHVVRRRAVPSRQVRRFFRESLPRVLDGHEARPGQEAMAHAVGRALTEETVAVLEAGTGTGKSLAYLVPAVLWALENRGRVAVATYTRTLQAQLATTDIPLMLRAGLRFRYAVLKGRGNYLCRRRLKEADDERIAAAQAGTPPDEQSRLIGAIARWAARAENGARADMAFPVDEETWERVGSDHDQTLRARCPHYAECFYYQARREAARADLLVVNHHLLLADLSIKAETGGAGILPRFDRIILDEGHHLEDTATSLFRARLTARSIQRALSPLLTSSKRIGGLARLNAKFGNPARSPLGPAAAMRVHQAVTDLERVLPLIHSDAPGWMEQIAAAALSPPETTLRVRGTVADEPWWQAQVAPILDEMGGRLAAAREIIAGLGKMLSEAPAEEATREPQPLFDLERAERRLGEAAMTVASFPGDDRDSVRWLELARSKRSGPPALPQATLNSAPIAVGPMLRDRVFEPLKSTVLTSATLTVHERFDHLVGRFGLGEGEPPTTGAFPSPFDYARQALLGIPRDLPPPDDPRYEAVTARALVAALEVSGGGAFVLCTSYRAVETFHHAVAAQLGDTLPLLRQGRFSRHRMLARFRELGNAVLFGTDSFWEGVSVRGAALRLVVIPRLPFRVPTEPVQQARVEKLSREGLDPFRAYSLPQAVLRLRQGTGRLVRSQGDRGAVLVLDRRVSSRWYGRMFLDSLPPMRRVVGPTRRVLEELRAFYAAGASATPPAG